MVRLPRKERKTWWLCSCACGKTVEVRAQSLIRGEAISCCLHWKAGPKNDQWGGFGEISASYFYNLRKNAATRNLVFEISLEYMWGLFLEQNRQCALSWLPLTFPRRYSCLQDRKQATASLDRIDSTKGYVEGNVQWVHKDINLMKNALDEKYFKELCRHVAATTVFSV